MAESSEAQREGQGGLGLSPDPCEPPPKPLFALDPVTCISGRDPADSEWCPVEGWWAEGRGGPWLPCPREASEVEGQVPYPMANLAGVPGRNLC